jgi:hypothetical protein
VRWDFGRSKEARDYLLSRFDKLYAIDPATLLNDWERERFSEHVGVAEKALSRLDRIIEAKDIYISPAIIHTRKDYALGYSENDKFILTISSETDDRYIPYKVGDYLFGENLDTSRTKDEQQGLVPNYIITALVEKLSPPAPTKEEIKQYSNTMQKDFPSVKTLYFDEINSGFTWQQLDNAINGVLRSKETHIIFGNWESITWRPLSPKSEKLQSPDPAARGTGGNLGYVRKAAIQDKGVIKISDCAGSCAGL